MQRSLVPESYFDAVAILQKAKKSLMPISAIEMHLYAYLACVIALWRGNSVSDWGYNFALTSEGFPFSPDFELARSTLAHRDCVALSKEGDMLPKHETLKAELELFFSESRWQDRGRFVSAATDSALTLPGGSLRYAISKTPGFGSAFILGQQSPLLTQHDTESIYEEYLVISSALEGNDVDMLSPAVVWLSARVLQKGVNF